MTSQWPGRACRWARAAFVMMLPLVTTSPALARDAVAALQVQRAPATDAERFAQALALFNSPRQPESISLFSQLIDDLSQRQNRSTAATLMLAHSLMYRAQVRLNLGQDAEADKDLKLLHAAVPNFELDDPNLSSRLRQRFSELTPPPPPPPPPTGPRHFPRVVFASFNRGYTWPLETSTSTFDFSIYGQNGNTTTEYAVNRGLNQYDVGVSARLWGALAIGVNISTTDTTSTGSITSRIPHPNASAPARILEADVPDLLRVERTFHVEIRATTGGRKYEAAVFAGPSLFDVRQEIVTNVTFREFTSSVQFLSADTRETRKRSVIGLNLGVDVSAMIVPVVGFGAYVRYSIGEATFTEGRDTMHLKLGGVQAGGGLRFRF